jgi:hypothetical protein
VAAAISAKFTNKEDKEEVKFKASTAGLLTLQEIKEKQSELLAKMWVFSYDLRRHFICFIEVQ